ncbi:MAG: ABC transporter permease [Candidatus Micrarchaeota archaeon]|nr:ABC transporter permease [Candidatus Micrarchaeota archaeon]
MLINDITNYIFRTFRYRKLRSYLTLLAILIGIASVIVIISISDGLIVQIDEQLKAFGPKNAVLIAGDVTRSGPIQTQNFRMPQEGKITIKDYETIKTHPAIKYITKRINFVGQMEYKKRNITVTVGGIEPEQFFAMTNLSAQKGRIILPQERKVAIVGEAFTDNTIFKDNPVEIGSFIYLGKSKKKFKVVGVLDPTNVVARNGILVHFEDAKELALEEEKITEDELSAVAFQVAEGYQLNEVVKEIEEKLKTSRKLPIDKKDFTIVTAEFILAQVGTIIGAVTLFLGFISGLSFFIGIIGIANTLYMGVVEKTKEIGIMRAVGATKKDIRNLIVAEGASFGLVGGILGLLVGMIVAQIISQFGFKTYVGIHVVLAALIISIVVGMIASYYPAKIAADLDPIKAISANAGR